MAWPPASSAAALEMRGVVKRFGATTALAGVDLVVQRGEIHALLGANGAGKSTLMGVLAGAVACDAGELRLGGAPFAPRGPMDARRAGIAMIHQELALAPHLTVAENILLGVEPTGGAALGALFGRPLLRREMRRRARAALDAIGRDDIDCDRIVGDLPLAARQCVEIARAAASDASVLLLDEPTSALGRADGLRLAALVRRLRDRGCAVVWISHALEEVRALCGRFTVLRDGRTAGSGELATTGDGELVALMAGAEARMGTGRAARQGREVGAMARDAGAIDDEVLLRVGRLAGERLPLDASLDLRRGEILGIAGLVGAGRSELLRTIFGLDPVRRGEVRVLGLDAPTPRRCWRRGAGFISEERRREGLLLGRPIAENLTLTRLPWRLGLRQEIEEAARWIAATGIRCAGPGQRVGALSGGNQQKVLLARLLRHDCDLLILDEPTRGVDVAAREAIWGLIRSAAYGSGGPARSNSARRRAVLVVSSAPGELLDHCDRVAVMRRGRLGGARSAAEWTEHELLSEAIGGEAIPVESARELEVQT